MKSSTFAVVTLSLASTAFAVEYGFSILPQSSVHFDAGVTAPLAGSLIGNWDETANPGGTRTLAGLFGGGATTNTAIPYTAILAVGTTIDSVPTGGFRIEVPTNGAPGTVRGFLIDLLGRTPGDLGATIDIDFDTFRTRTPNSLYVGGSFLPPIPLFTGSIDALRVEQTAEAQVTTVIGAGSIAFAGTVPVNFVMRVTLLGQPLIDVALPASVPLAGTIDTTGPDPVVTLSFATGASTPLPALPDFQDQAVALPTILPPGSTANLLFSGSIDGPASTFSTSVSANIVATGAATPVDINHDGRVDGRDIGALLGMWGSANQAGDLDGNGIVDGADLGLLLNCWTID